MQKLSSSLEVQRSMFMIGSAHIDAMDVSRGGRVAIAGGFYGTLNIAGTTLSSDVPKKFGDVFVAKFHPDGDLQYARKLSGNVRANVGGLGMDSYGQVVLGVNFAGSCTVDGNTWTAPESDVQLALIKLSGVAGETRWPKVYSGSGALNNYVEATAVRIGSSDRVLVTGKFKADADFGRRMIDGSLAGNAFFGRFYQ